MQRASLRTAITVMASLLVGGIAVRGERPQDPPPRKTADGKPVGWMEGKLLDSQDVFAGLTRGDFDQIQVNARRMQVSHLLEQWSRDRQLTRNSDYEAQANVYDFAVKELIRSSQRKDIHQALEAYTRLSQSCVRCHELIRDGARSGDNR